MKQCPKCGYKPTSTLGVETKQAVTAWSWVLGRFKAPRKLIPGEDATIARQIQEKGLEAVLLAFKGALNEPKTRDFDPAKFVSLRRIFDPKHFEKMVTLGAQYDAQKKARKQAFYEPPKDEHIPADPERVKKLMKDIFAKID